MKGTETIETPSTAKGRKRWRIWVAPATEPTLARVHSNGPEIRVLGEPHDIPGFFGLERERRLPICYPPPRAKGVARRGLGAPPVSESMPMEVDLLRAELERLFELDELLTMSRDLLGFEPETIRGTAG